MKEKIQPLLKWVGGKRQLLPSLLENMPKRFEFYAEPFLGGGALFFHLQPKNAVVCDVNSELVNFYSVVKNSPEELIETLLSFSDSEDFFYSIRKLDRDPDSFSKLSNVYKAARTYYLNRVCFNGLYRVTKKGFFNAPYGKQSNNFIVNHQRIRLVSSMLNEGNITIVNDSFESIIPYLKENSFIYLDPPYDPLSQSSSFTNYSNGGFNKDMQIKLKEFCDFLSNNGHKFLLSNSATPFIIDLYKDYKEIIVKANRRVNSVASKRGLVDEILVRNY
ncbi:MAG: DNA adenine methylase [Succinivibrio sp.]|nr:DNA adenine methylase [Succinivibrio sp.]